MKLFYSDLKHFQNLIINHLINRQNKQRDRSVGSRSRPRSRSSKRRRVSRSRSRSQETELNNHEERSQQREQTASASAAPSTNLIDRETIARLREQHYTPTAFAINLMQLLFTMDEMTVKNVNVEGLKGKRSKVPAVALSPRRVAELKRLTLENVAKPNRELMWKRCRAACNNKLSFFKNDAKKKKKKKTMR